MSKKQNVILFILSAIVIFFLGCNFSANTDETITTIETDGMASWIKKANEEPLHSKKKELLLKAYQANNKIQYDTLRKKNLLALTDAVHKIKDTSFFKTLNSEILTLSKKIKDTSGIAEFHWNQAIFYKNKEVKDSAYYHYNKAYQLYNTIDNTYYSGKMLYNMAFIQGRIKNYTRSEVLLFKAISTFKPLKRYLNIYKCYNYLGLIYIELKEYDRAIYYYDEALTYLDKVKNKKNYKERTFNNIGLVHQAQGDQEQAKFYFESALNNFNPKLKNNNFKARLMDNLAYSKFLNGETKNLPQALYKALQIRERLNNTEGIIINKLHLAEYYATYDDTTKAIQYAKETNKLAKNINNNRDRLAALKFLSQIDKNNSKKHLKNYILLKDSLQVEERKTRNKYTRIRFETDAYVEQTKHLKQQKIGVIVVSAISILVVLLLYFIKRQHAKNKALKFDAAQQKYSKEIYSLMLKQQLNLEKGRVQERTRISEELHDGVLGKLFGTRMSMGFLQFKGEASTLKKQKSLIGELQDIEKEIRIISHDLKNDIVSSRLSFVNMVESLVETQSKIGGYTYNIKHDPTINWNDIDEKIKINVYRIIQEALFNINKYANANKVDINFKFNNNIFKLYIEDNGDGFDIKKRHHGIGISNMLSRTQKLKGEFFINSKIKKGTKIVASINV